MFFSSSHEVIRLFSCSTQLSMKFQLLIKTKIKKSKIFSGLVHSVDVFILLINVKMATNCWHFNIYE